MAAKACSSWINFPKEASDAVLLFHTVSKSRQDIVCVQLSILGYAVTPTGVFFFTVDHM